MSNVFHVKVRTKGERGWWFLASAAGAMNRLRVHAVRFADRIAADRVVAEITRENDGVEAKVTS